jgi:hypothetical protein
MLIGNANPLVSFHGISLLYFGEIGIDDKEQNTSRSQLFNGQWPKDGSLQVISTRSNRTSRSTCRCEFAP